MGISVKIPEKPPSLNGGQGRGREDNYAALFLGCWDRYPKHRKKIKCEAQCNHQSGKTQAQQSLDPGVVCVVGGEGIELGQGASAVVQTPDENGGIVLDGKECGFPNAGPPVQAF